MIYNTWLPSMMMAAGHGANPGSTGGAPAAFTAVIRTAAMAAAGDYQQAVRFAREPTEWLGRVVWRGLFGTPARGNNSASKGRPRVAKVCAARWPRQAPHSC